MKSSVKTIYNRNKRLDKFGKAPVVIEVYFPITKERKFINTGYKFEPEYWDSEKNCIKKAFPFWRAFEQTINNIVYKVESHEYKLIEEGKHLLPEHIDKVLANKQKLTKFIDFYHETMLIENHLEPGTRKEHKYTYNLLEQFAPDITLDQVDYKFAKEFDTYLRGLSLKQNTIYKHHQHVRRFFGEAKKQGIITEEPQPAYSNFVSKKEKSDRVALTTNDVAALEELKDVAEEMKVFMDLFLFACYTGLRFIDVTTLTPDDIIKQDSLTYIRKKMIKVKKSVTLPVSLLFEGKPLEIIEKYRSKDRETCFPIYTNQTVNKALKAFAIGAGIKTNLSFHIARHTFGTMLAEKTQNPYLIMELMGHADIKTSMIYIHYSLLRINQQLKNVDWELCVNSENQ